MTIHISPNFLEWVGQDQDHALAKKNLKKRTGEENGVDLAIRKGSGQEIVNDGDGVDQETRIVVEAGSISIRDLI